QRGMMEQIVADEREAQRAFQQNVQSGPNIGTTPPGGRSAAIQNPYDQPTSSYAGMFNNAITPDPYTISDVTGYSDNPNLRRAVPSGWPFTEASDSGADAEPTTAASETEQPAIAPYKVASLSGNVVPAGMPNVSEQANPMIVRPEINKAPEQVAEAELPKV